MKKRILTITFAAAVLLAGASSVNKSSGLPAIPPPWCPPVCSR